MDEEDEQDHGLDLRHDRELSNTRDAFEEAKGGAQMDEERKNIPPTLFLENGVGNNSKRKRGVRFEDELETTSFENFEELDEDEDEDDEEDFEPSEDTSSGEERFEEFEDEEEELEDMNQDSENGEAFTSMQTEAGSKKDYRHLRELKIRLKPLKKPLLTGSSSSHSCSSSESTNSDSSSDSSDSESSSASSNSESDSSDDSSRSSSEDNGSGPETISSKMRIPLKDPKATNNQASTQAAPGKGKPGTKARNARRRASNKLKYQQKILGTKVDETNSKKDGNLEDISAVEMPSARNKRKIVHDNLVKSEGSGPGETRKKRVAQATNEMSVFEAKRHALLKQIATGGVDIDYDLLHSSTAKEAILPSAVAEAPHDQAPKPNTRNKLDIASSRRLLFGSLGVRAPKDKAEEEGLRAKLSATGRKPAKAPEIASASIAVTLETKPVDPNLWKKKIDLRAVECYDEEIELSTPPFPFVQRWDPQQQLKGKNRKNKKKKQYADSHDNEYAENHHSFGQEGGSELLDYDDAIPSVQNENNQLSEQLVEDIVPTSPSDTDLPLLPEDVSSCENLTTLNALPGAIIAFKQLEVSAATKWQPAYSAYRTATIDSVKMDFLLNLTLAKRDRKNNATEYDDKGQRVYGRFEMPDDEEDEDDEGIIEIALGEMVEPKLIQAAPEETAETLEKELELLEKGMDGAESCPTLFIPDSVDPGEYHAKSDDNSEKQIEDSQMTMQVVSSNDFNGGQAAQRPADASTDSYESSSWVEANA